MTGLLLIRDLAVVLLIAGAAAWVCRRLGLSADYREGVSAFKARRPAVFAGN